MTPLDPDAQMEAMAELLGLPLEDCDRAAVAAYLTGAARMAARLDAVPLDDAELALAPTFRLPEAPGDADG